MSDTVGLALVNLIGVAISGYIAYKMMQLKNSQDDAAKKVEEVRSDLKTESNNTSGQLISIHTLVNSKMGAVLKALAVAMRRVADETKSQIDLDAAAIAERQLADHETRQAAVDQASPLQERKQT